MNTLATTFDALMSHTTLLVMWGALFLHWVCPIPARFNPIQYWRILADAIEEKVNHSRNGEKQQEIAGCLAFSLLWGTVGIIYLITHHMLGVNEWINLLLLWLALQGKPILDLAKNVQMALLNQDKPQARQSLAKVLNRDMLGLSDSDIAQAGTETLLIGYFRGIFAVLFFYLIGGSITALMYCLLTQLCRVWSPRLNRFSHFGLTCHRFLSLIEWIPIRLFTLITTMNAQTLAAYTLIKEHAHQWPQQGNGWLLAAMGTKYQISFGDSVIYDGFSHSRPKIGGNTPTSAFHLIILSQAIKYKTLMSLIILSVFIGLMHG